MMGTRDQNMVVGDLGIYYCHDTGGMATEQRQIITTTYTRVKQAVGRFVF